MRSPSVYFLRNSLTIPLRQSIFFQQKSCLRLFFSALYTGCAPVFSSEFIIFQKGSCFFEIFML